MIPSNEAWVCNTVHQGGCLPLKSLPCRKLSWYNQREIELGWWVYRMLSAGVADVCAIIMLWALSFYCRTIASNNFYVCDQCVTNSPEFQKRSKKSEEVSPVCRVHRRPDTIVGWLSIISCCLWIVWLITAIHAWWGVLWSLLTLWTGNAFFSCGWHSISAAFSYWYSPLLFRLWDRSFLWTQ